MPALRSLVLASLLAGPDLSATQFTLGGCAENAPGSYYARVTSRTPARELTTSTTFVILEFGDEVRVCRSSDSTAVITLQQRGVGFLVDPKALVRLRTWTRRQLPRHERNCLARAIDQIQAQYAVDEQTRHLLVLARGRHVSFFQLFEIRMDPYPRGPCPSSK